MKRSIAHQLASRKRRILQRLAQANRDKYRRCEALVGPVLEAAGVRYELADKVRGVAYGGVGLMVKLAQQVGLVEAIGDAAVQYRARVGLCRLVGHVAQTLCSPEAPCTEWVTVGPA